MALGARPPGVAGRMSSRATSARQGRGRPSWLIMHRSHPCDGQSPLVQILANAGIFTCVHQANVAVAWKLGWFRCQRSAGRDVAPGMFSTDRSVAGTLRSAGLDEGIGMGQLVLSSRPPSSRHGHRTAGGVKTIMRLTDLVLGLR